MLWQSVLTCIAAMHGSELMLYCEWPPTHCIVECNLQDRVAHHNTHTMHCGMLHLKKGPYAFFSIYWQPIHNYIHTHAIMHFKAPQWITSVRMGNHFYDYKTENVAPPPIPIWCHGLTFPPHERLSYSSKNPQGKLIVSSTLCNQKHLA